MPPDPSTPQGKKRRTSAPCPFAADRRSRSFRHRIRSGKSTIHRRRTAALSTGRKPRRFSARGSPAATATHDAAHGNRNPALLRFPPSSARQLHARRSGIARATTPRRNIEARRDRLTSDQRHRDAAERAIAAVKGGGYVCSHVVNGVLCGIAHTLFQFVPGGCRSRPARLGGLKRTPGTVALHATG